MLYNINYPTILRSRYKNNEGTYLNPLHEDFFPYWCFAVGAPFLYVTYIFHLCFNIKFTHYLVCLSLIVYTWMYYSLCITDQWNLSKDLQMKRQQHKLYMYTHTTDSTSLLHWYEICHKYSVIIDPIHTNISSFILYRYPLYTGLFNSCFFFVVNTFHCWVLHMWWRSIVY